MAAGARRQSMRLGLDDHKARGQRPRVAPDNRDDGIALLVAMAIRGGDLCAVVGAHPVDDDRGADCEGFWPRHRRTLCGRRGGRACADRPCRFDGLECRARRLDPLLIYRRCADRNASPCRRHDHRSRCGTQRGELRPCVGLFRKRARRGHVRAPVGAQQSALATVRLWSSWRCRFSAPPSSPFYIVALVADDPSERDGDPLRDAVDPTDPGAGIIQVRGEAFGPRGSHRAVALMVARAVARPAGPAALRVISWRGVG